MYLNQPVLIPSVKGKIVFQKKGETNYVMYEIGRAYDPNRRYTIPERRVIGVRIPGRPEMMLPNENYLTYFPKGAEKMTEQEKETIETYTQEREYGRMLRDFFDQLFFEFQTQSRRTPNQVINAYKAERLNRVLKPLKELMRDEPYAAFLEEIPMPETAVKEGKEITTGLTYSDTALMMTQFKGAVNRYFQKQNR